MAAQRGWTSGAGHPHEGKPIRRGRSTTKFPPPHIEREFQLHNCDLYLRWRFPDPYPVAKSKRLRTLAEPRTRRLLVPDIRVTSSMSHHKVSTERRVALGSSLSQRLEAYGTLTERLLCGLLRYRSKVLPCGLISSVSNWFCFGCPPGIRTPIC